MYRFHYDYFRKKYAAAKILFKYTDSLMYCVERADIYKELFAEREHFDFASFDKAARLVDRLAASKNGLHSSTRPTTK